MKNKSSIIVRRFHFPCGEMILGSFDGKICLCDWSDGISRNIIDFRLQKLQNALYVDKGTTEVIETARQQLNEYFQRKRREFDLPLLLVGSDFQKRVWDELLAIPYGTTLSYGEMARRLGDRKAVRAVANACAVNAISIIVPCHRVVGNNGKLVGYGGGLERKRFLLDLELEI